MAARGRGGGHDGGGRGHGVRGGGDRGRAMSKRRGEQPMVPSADFGSYYGKAILNPPVWAAADIAGYLFLGGLAGGSSLLGAGADLTGRPVLAKVVKTGAAGAGALSLAA
ncbi:MAG TPA: polysulfide reductase, partial [Trebonia sp.]